MPKYISLIGWTEQGIKGFQSTVARAEAAQAAATALGGSMEIYWTVGSYDMVAISDFPDQDAATAFLLQVGSLGNVRTTTLVAHTAEDMARIIAKAG
ncbi:MAG TPA: GYD domain-containing protein [Candidatus Limnocylindrales bacterium]|nr:GYD domain-containing protein [Candidatus Limnocylindrales bacterium]